MHTFAKPRKLVMFPSVDMVCAVCVFIVYCCVAMLVDQECVYVQYFSRAFCTTQHSKFKVRRCVAWFETVWQHGAHVGIQLW
jgi:hypothetical protein